MTASLAGADRCHPEGRRIQTLWRDRAALDGMRAGPEPPAAPALFEAVGGEPVLSVLSVAGEVGR